MKRLLAWLWSWWSLRWSYFMAPRTLVLESEPRPVMPRVPSRRRRQRKSRKTLRRTTGGWGGAVAL